MPERTNERIEDYPSRNFRLRVFIVLVFYQICHHKIESIIVFRKSLESYQQENANLSAMG